MLLCQNNIHTLRYLQHSILHQFIYIHSSYPKLLSEPFIQDVNADMLNGALPGEQNGERDQSCAS